MSVPRINGFRKQQQDIPFSEGEVLAQNAPTSRAIQFNTSVAQPPAAPEPDDGVLGWLFPNKQREEHRKALRDLYNAQVERVYGSRCLLATDYQGIQDTKIASQAIERDIDELEPDRTSTRLLITMAGCAYQRAATNFQESGEVQQAINNETLGRRR